MERRYLVNEDTGVIFSYGEYMSGLSHMRECDAAGNQFAKTLSTETNESGDEVTVELESLNWRQLKKMVISQGGEWNNKKEAIEFLRAE